MTSDGSLNVLLAAWAPFYAGAEVALERLAVGLRGAGHGVNVLLGTDGETAERLRQAQIAVHSAPLAFTDKFRWLRYRRAQLAVARTLDAVQPDVVHFNDLPTAQMVAQSAGKYGIPRVCHHRWIFDGAAIDWLNKFGSERHLFVSQALKDQLRHASARLAAAPGQVVYDGLPLPPAPTNADRVAARRRLELPLDGAIVLFAGQIIERKGVEDLLRAWAVLGADASRHATLAIVGDDLENAGMYRRQMESLSAELHCSARFVGFQRNVAEWITAADLCVVPSHAEPLGNATLEAMAHSRPVVGSDVGGIPEMIVPGETGLLVPPRSPAQLAQALGILLGDAPLRSRLGSAARERCERHFSLTAHVDAVTAQYRSVLTQPAAIA